MPHQTHKNKHPFYISMGFLILASFITLFTVGMLALMGVMYYRMSKNAVYTSTNLMKQTSNIVHIDLIHSNMQPISILSENLADLISRKILDVNHQEQFLNYIYSLLQIYSSLPMIQAIVWGDENGHALVQEKQENGTTVSEMIHAKLSRGVIRDAQGKIIKSFVAKTEYDPRNRPWYVEVKKSGATTWSSLFSFQLESKHYWGLGVATPVYDANKKLLGVVFIGTRIDYFGQSLTQIPVSKHGTINIMTADGVLFGTSASQIQKALIKKPHKVDEVNIPALSKAFQIYKQTHAQEFFVKENNQRYIATFKPINGNRWFIAVLAPDTDFIAAIKRANLETLIVGFIILLLGIMFLLKIVHKIVQPLKIIAEETDKIKNFRLAKTRPIQSRITEIVRISTAINNMKHGLRSFKKYVPASLVRQLIQKGQDAKIGGTKKYLAILFSDVANFTTISETVLPDELMHHLCHYLDELSKIVMHNKGTIDKYIGDSIMAFWGAPLSETHPCHYAARAALDCKKRSQELNQQWEIEKKEILTTRFGIHYGEAIVGNLGSNDHLSYTAIGDSINIASRLEAINKNYHTQIIVSDTVFNIIKNDFILRMIDKVVLKGKTKPMIIFQLMAEKIDDIQFDLESYNKVFLNAFSHYEKKLWEEAIQFFHECLRIFPEDTIAPVFISRCEIFKEKAAPKNWNGTWYFVGK